MAEKEQSSWLKELQQKSWEPEILLSGIVLYGMFQIPDLLDDFLFYFRTNVLGSFGDIKTMVSILTVSVYWLTAGLIIHLFSRGIWIGFVGLSYTFPEGVKSENLKYKGRFHKKVAAIPPLEKIVDRLEKICSSIFSTSFMFFMSVLGGYSFIFVLLAAPYMALVLNGVEDGSTAMWAYRTFYTYPIVILGLTSFFDFISMGALKRIKFLEPIYWPVHQFVSTITFSRFYRNIYYAFGSHVNAWVLRLMLVIFTVSSVFLAANTNSNDPLLSRIDIWHDSSKYGISSVHYDNLSGGNPTVTASIQSDVISSNVLKVFIASHIFFQDQIKKEMGYDSLTEERASGETAFDLEMVNRYYQVYLDDSLVVDRKLYYHFKKSTSQKGFIAYLDISGLPTGIHELIIGPPSGEKRRIYERIKFYRE